MKSWLTLASVLLLLTSLGLGCAALPLSGNGKGWGKRLAFLPLDNFSGSREAIDEVGAAIKRELKARDYQLVSDDKLATFLHRYRIRQTGMIAPQTAGLIGKELAVDLV